MTQHNEPGSIDAAVEALREGSLIVYPTETFYGLGADPFSPKGLARLFELKPRAKDKPVALIAADAEMAFAVACEVPASAQRLADAFWPGPLTLVIPARPGLPKALVGPDGGVGIRVSSHPIAREIARRLGRPIIATSANLPGAVPASEIASARASFGGQVKVYLEGGTLAAARPSTLVAFRSSGIVVLRPGAISERQLTTALASEARK